MAVATTQSWQEHTSDGSTAYFPFNFNYDTTRPGTIVVGKRTADNTYSVVDASNYELIPNAAGDGGQIRFIQNPSGSQIIDDIPPAGTIIRIERVSVDTSNATWQIGLEMSELVNLFDRLFRLVQENKNNFANVIKTFETQHNISLYELLSEHDNHLLYWDNTTQTLTPTDFPKEDVVRATDGMFLRISTDTAGNPYLEWSLTGTDNWHSVSDTAVEALSKINNHLADKNNPHETAVSKLTDVELTNLSANQFLSFDGSKWKNVNYNTTVTWGGILGNILDQTDLNNTFVHKSGDTMTGDLEFQYNASYPKLRIIQSGQNTNDLRFINNNFASQSISFDLSQAAIHPLTTGRGHLGTSDIHFGDAHIDKVYTGVINNGYDIAVPVTNSADTLALKSQVDDAANSGEQLYTTGVWYAKMYAATVVPTGAEYDGQNYADFSQVDNDNNPIVVIYEGQSGSWVEIARITPPANHVAYLTITSKIWDIAEQTDQQGGEVLWSYNQKTFTPYPKIISLLNQANTDLSNLTPTGEAKFVRSTGNEDVAGQKTFTDTPIIKKATGSTLDFVDTDDLTSTDGGCTINAFHNTNTKIGNIDFYRRGTLSQSETHTYAGTADLAVIKPDNSDGYISGSADVLSSLVHLTMPNYGAGIISTTGTAATNGFLYAKNQGSSGSPDAILTLTQGGNTLLTISLVWVDSIMIPVPKGISWAITDGYNPYACFYPCYGG